MDDIFTFENTKVNIKLADDIESITEKDFDEMLDRLPDWQRKKALSYYFFPDRVLSAKSFLLLEEQLKECYGITGNIEFEYEQKGKPILKENRDVHFNISHCKKAILTTVSTTPVGCDIEEIPAELNMNICNYSFNENELKEILNGDNPCVEFARLWTMKEAFVKLTGEGITENLPNLFSEDVINRISFKTKVYEEKGYVYTVCVWR